MKLQVEEVATQEQVEAVVNEVALTKSGKIKALFVLGLEVKEIAVKTGYIYNMCYNVVTNYVLTNGLEVIKEKKTSKKDLVFDLFDQGMNNMMVAKETQTNYNYICKLRKEYKMIHEPKVEEILEQTGTEDVAVLEEVAVTVEGDVEPEAKVMVEHPVLPKRSRKDVRK